MRTLCVSSIVLTFAVSLHPLGWKSDAQAAEPKKVKKPQLTWQEKNYLAPIDKRLVTRLNNKTNPGDRDTWYVLMFRDTAGVQTRSITRDSQSETRTLTTEGAKWNGAIVVHGRSEAALTVARHLTGGNAAAQSLKIPVQHSQQQSQTMTNKVWDYMAFPDEESAQAALFLLMPEQAKASLAKDKK